MTKRGHKCILVSQKIIIIILWPTEQSNKSIIKTNYSTQNIVGFTVIVKKAFL